MAKHFSSDLNVSDKSGTILTTIFCIYNKFFKRSPKSANFETLQASEVVKMS